MRNNLHRAIMMKKAQLNEMHKLNKPQKLWNNYIKKTIEVEAVKSVSMTMWEHLGPLTLCDPLSGQIDQVLGTCKLI